MNCEDIWNLISARMDGQIGDEDRARLESHLAGCAVCRSVDESFRAGDEGLRKAFAPGRQAAAEVSERTVSRLRGVRNGSRSRRFGVQLVAAAAAGFALAALIFQPWARTPPPQTVAKKPALAAAELAFAAGDVEVQPKEGVAWRPLARGEGIGAGSRIRTSPRALVELRTGDGSTVRLNEATEVRLASARAVDLVRGRIWSDVAHDETPFVVNVPGAAVTALGTKFDVDLDEGRTWLTVVEGATKVTGAEEAEIVPAGWRAKIEGGKVLEKTRTREIVTATSWVNRLLLLKGEEGKTEFAGRLEDLLAAIGDAKISHLRGGELEQLGESCVRPLLSYLASARSRGSSQGQETAARTIAVLAPPWAVRDIIIHMLPHESRAVRVAGANALKRLTGETQGHEPEEWESRSWAEMEPVYHEWLAWWEKNQSRYRPEG